MSLENETCEIFDCPWKGCDIKLFTDDFYEKDEIDISWSEFDANKYELFPIEVIQKVFNIPELVCEILLQLENIKDVLMVNKMFRLEGTKIIEDKKTNEMFDLVFGNLTDLDLGEKSICEKNNFLNQYMEILFLNRKLCEYCNFI